LAELSRVDTNQSINSHSQMSVVGNEEWRLKLPKEYDINIHESTDRLQRRQEFADLLDQKDEERKQLVKNKKKKKKKIIHNRFFYTV